MRASTLFFQGGLIPALKDVLNAESDLAEVEGSHDSNGWHEEMDVLTRELNDLMARGTPPVTRGGGRLRAGSQTATTRATGKRSASSGGAGAGAGATRGKGSKKKRSAEAAAPAPRSRSAKRTRRSS